jgi:Flp pilus assembly protein TadG
MKPAAHLRRFWRDRRGVSATILALLAPALIGLTGMVIDFGHVYWVKQNMQAATDAAAVAAGWEIPNNSAIATAATYSSATGDKNFRAGITGVTETAVLSCLGDQTANVGLCTGTELAGGANVVKVTETDAVPTYFLGLAGISTLTVTTTAMASARGGPGTALNVEIVLDATASMGSGIDGNCGLGGNATREQCALAGITALLQGLNPNIDYVGLEVFPGFVSAADASQDYNCGGNLPSSDNAPYNTNPIYEVVPISTSGVPFKTSPSGTTLNPSSNIVGAVGAAGCSSGVQPVGGQGSYFAEAIAKAQQDLANLPPPPHSQNVIVVLSDGGMSSTKVQVDFNGKIASVTTKGVTTTTLTVSSVQSGTGSLSVGQTITGSGVTSGTTIKALGTGTGGTGTYILSTPSTVTNNTSMVAANNITLNGTSYTQNIDQCQQAISAAKAAAAAGTWVYSVAYGSQSTGQTTCTTDTTGPLAGLSSCTEMQDIASALAGQPGPTFFSNGNNGQVCPTASSVANLVTLFQNLSVTLTEPRLIPVNTT